MKFTKLLVVYILLLTTVTACRKTPGQTLETLPLKPTPTESTTEKEIFEVGDARFTSRRIAIDGIWAAAADLNNDGNLDLVAGGEPELTIFLGDGRGGLAAFSQVPSGQQPDHFVLADLDEDRNADIVIANHDTNYITILSGNGDGSFQPAPNSPLQITVSPHPHETRAVDLDNDGHLDLVVDDRDAPGYLILKGLGDGTFELPGTTVEVGGDPYRGMAFGDLDGDGDLDLVSPNPNEVGVLLNVSQDQIAFEQAVYVPAQTPFAVALGDFNGDGRLDLMTGSGESSSIVELFWGDGAGGFNQAEDSPYQFALGAKQIIVGDFNGDGVDDAAISAYRTTDVLVLLGGREALQTDTLPGIEHPWGLVAADLNADGIDDLLIGDDTAPAAIIYLSASH